MDIGDQYSKQKAHSTTEAYGGVPAARDMPEFEMRVDALGSITEGFDPLIFRLNNILDRLTGPRVVEKSDGNRVDGPRAPTPSGLINQIERHLNDLGNKKADLYALVDTLERFI